MENRILIVDDEEMLCTVLAQRLTNEGYACVTANHGKEALWRLYRDDISLVISDIRMPEMNGMELLKDMKTVNPNMMVIIMTGYPEIEIAVEAMRLGAYDFVIKPIDLDLVVMCVRKALEKKRLEEELEAYHRTLERLVEERTVKLQEALIAQKRIHLDSVKILVGAIDAKDPYTRGHSDRVRKMSVKIGEKLGFKGKRLENLEYGALLHDIGKIGIKDEVLQKRGPLSAEEYCHIKKHPLIGVKIVEGVDFFKEMLPMIRHHHERFDGSGYPDGLVGEVIPAEARIIAISDAFDAMNSTRPHRPAKVLDDMLAEFEKFKGKQFDPHIFEILLEILRPRS